jgi:Raf kinase inhibitor-like YbhB/YbcL family protein
MRALAIVLIVGLVPSGGTAMAFELTSAAFKAGDAIPRKHTCDGDDRSPPLAWTDPPGGTKSFALVCDDPDAPRGTWVHWVVYAIPPSTRGLPEGGPADGSRPGTNDFRKTGYGGPCPPPGPAHRYVFKLHALDATLDLAPGATKAALEKAMEGHVLGRAELMGRYARQ